MQFEPIAVPGVFVIEPERTADERGFFARLFSDVEFASRGLATQFAQCSISYNRREGTLRGMHFQAPPEEEAKLIRCTSGAVYDVVVDLRPHSPAFRRWASVELSAANRRLIYVPEGVAHGYQTLADDSELFYQITKAYAPAAARGVRWDDPAFGIAWPHATERVISPRDRSFPDFTA